MVEIMTSKRSPAALLQRGIISLHMVALAAQVILAVLFLGGEYRTLPLHALNAELVLALGVAQAVVVLFTWPSGQKLWKPAAVLVVLAEVGQIQLGHAAELGAHVTLGTVLWGLSLALLIQVWAPNWGRRPVGALA